MSNQEQDYTKEDEEKYFEAVNFMYRLSQDHPDIAAHVEKAQGAGAIFDGLQDGRKLYFEDFDRQKSSKKVVRNLKSFWLDTNRPSSKNNDRSQDKGKELEP